jgi:hypothetical protein
MGGPRRRGCAVHRRRANQDALTRAPSQTIDDCRSLGRGASSGG